MLNLKHGALIAFAAGSLFATACSKSSEAPADKSAKVQCMGVNECKGHGACKTANNACAGQNGCAGQGMVEMAADACKDKGGHAMAKK